MSNPHRPGPAQPAKPAALSEPPKQTATTADNGATGKPYVEAPDAPKPVPDPKAAAYGRGPVSAAAAGCSADWFGFSDVVKLATWAANPTTDPEEMAARRFEVRSIFLTLVDQIAPE